MLQFFFSHTKQKKLNMASSSVTSNNNQRMNIEIRNKTIYYICQCEQEFDSESAFKSHREAVHGDQFGESNNENNEIKELYCPQRISKNEILELTKKLNKEQRTLVMHILKCIKTGTNLALRIFLNGSAGVGKSFVINTLYQLITNYYDTLPGANQASIKVLLTALSGKAANNISGMTIHSAFSLLVESTKDRMGEKTKKALRKQMQDLKFIIIDEISYVSASLLERVNRRLQNLYPNSSTFGGFSVIFVGDLLQLPPIGKFSFLPQKEGISESDDKGFSALWSDFKYFKLNEIMRQTGGQENFIDALNNMAHGTMTDANIALIKSSEGREAPADATYLFRYNADVDKHNNAKIANHREIGVDVYSTDQVISRNVSEETKRTLLEEIRRKKYQETRGLPSKLSLKTGIKYVITTNLDVSDGLVNGSVGELKHILYNNQEPPMPAVLFLDFNCGSQRNVGNKAKTQLSNEERNEIGSNDWVPIRMKQVKMQHSKVSINREQFPLYPAEGQTIHKAQGQTYDGACVAVAGTSRQMKYVAMSRVRKSDDLSIQGDFKAPEPPSPNDPTMRFLEELKSNRNLEISFNSLEQKSGPVVAFHNVNSFLAAQPHIAYDKWYERVDLLILSETKTMKSDKSSLSLPYFKLIHHSECLGDRNSFGVLIFAKDTINVEITQNIIRKTNKKNSKPHRSEVIVLKLDDYYVMTGYKSPSTLDSIFVNQIEIAIKETSGKRLLIGDFDNNWTEKDSLAQLMEKCGLQNKLPVQSTVAFANFTEISSGEYVSYISDYAPVFCELLPNVDEQMDID
ncbi:ATP-dependent DNA helicase pif1-like [Sitodiplosis mosellana]|uniref:ATP-dependent DNA helicase pif1-like n=1 Tax=Sitodiplosis mosellana TaxID=263140 RepID=UPI002444D0ED|nr:ATP-dependent DNA helicase pif1-like [Sitodiplosis mosellana]